LGSGDKPGHISKHQRRVAWLEQHAAAVYEALGLDPDWTIEGAFVVDEDLLDPYLHETPVPILTVRKFLAQLKGPA